MRRNIAYQSIDCMVWDIFLGMYIEELNND